MPLWRPAGRPASKFRSNGGGCVFIWYFSESPNQSTKAAMAMTFRHAGRDFRLTDVHGRIVTGLLA
jgi:hypothetical protein